MTARDIRLQAAILRDRHLLLVRCVLPGGLAFWILPGGGREQGESDEEAVAREVREEALVEVEVGPMLYDVQADPPDGTYTRWRTFRCSITRGEPAAGGGDEGAELTHVRWLPLDREASWEADLRGDLFLYPQLLRIRGALGEPPGSGSSPLPDEAARSADR